MSLLDDPRAAYNGITTPVMRPLDKTALSMVPRGDAAQAAHAALDPMQRLRPEVIVMGAAMLFAALCERCGVDPQTLHAMGRKALTDQDYHRKDNAALQSLKDFAGIRMMGEKGVSIS